MRRFCWHRRRLNVRRLVVAATLAAYLVTIIGLPLPVVRGKQHASPFPCQHHACGCLSADECWDHCCCYSAEQKLAWAHEHGVEPPASLVAEVAAAALAQGDAAQVSGAGIGSCCADDHDHAGDEDADHEHHGQHRTVAKKSACGHCAANDDDVEDASVGFVLGVQARQCRGHVDQWCLSGAVLTPPVVDWQFLWRPLEWLSADIVPLASLDPVPPVPPPRV